MIPKFLLVVSLLLVGPVPAAVAEGPGRLPDTVAKPGYLDRVPSPSGDRALFFLLRPGQAARFGVAGSDGTILWQKHAGYRPIVSHAWSADGRQVVFVTDCVQPEAELRSPRKDTCSYRSCDARGTIAAEGDLDTDVSIFRAIGSMPPARPTSTSRW